MKTITQISIDTNNNRVSTVTEHEVLLETDNQYVIETNVGLMILRKKGACDRPGYSGIKIESPINYDLFDLYYIGYYIEGSVDSALEWVYSKHTKLEKGGNYDC